MPTRILREGITTSERLSSITFESECLFYRLLVMADDFGLMDGRPIIVRAKCMPLRDVTLGQIDTWLAELEGAGLVLRYQADSKPFIAIHRTRQRTRSKGSKCPLPTADWLTHDRQSSDGCPAYDGQLPDSRPSSAHVVGDVVGDGDVVEDEVGDEGRGQLPATPPADKATKARAKRIGYQAFLAAAKAAGEEAIPADDPVFDYAEKVGIPEEFLELAWREFEGRYSTNGKLQVGLSGWRQTFRNAVKSNWFRLWWFNPDGVCALTTPGIQAQRNAKAVA